MSRKPTQCIYFGSQFNTLKYILPVFGSQINSSGYELFGEHFMCGKDLSLKSRWSPIRKLVTLAASTQNTFVTETNHCATPGHINNNIILSKMIYQQIKMLVHFHNSHQLNDTRYEHRTK